MEIKYLILMLIAMLFMHVWNDFGRQGIMIQMKQKRWWRENAPAYKYHNDYKIVLAAHSFSWSFCIMIPVAIAAFATDNEYLLIMLIPLLLLNTVAHAIIDDSKANDYKINLVQDQFGHLAQIFITWLVAIMFL